MTDSKTLFLDKDLRCGGFYELCIQVCPSVDTKPIEFYSNHFWTLSNIQGPFDDLFNRIDIPKEYYELQGILTLDNFAIPFMTFNIREQEPIETGFNWFDICFYTATLDQVFGFKDHHWSEPESCPAILKNFLVDTIRKLNSIYPFQLAFIDFEISGQYYLHNFKNDDLNNWTNTKLFIGQENFNGIKNEYKNSLTIVD